MTVTVPALTDTETSLPVTLRAALDSAADLARAEVGGYASDQHHRSAAFQDPDSL